MGRYLCTSLVFTGPFCLSFLSQQSGLKKILVATYCIISVKPMNSEGFNKFITEHLELKQFMNHLLLGKEPRCSFRFAFIFIPVAEYFIRTNYM